MAEWSIMNITKERIASIIIHFFKEQKNLSYYALSEKTGADQKSLKAWEMQEHESIRFSSLENLVTTLQNDISLSFKEFSDFVIAELDNDGISMEYTQEIFNNTKDISSIIMQLLQIDISKQKTLQEKIGTANIIQTLKTFFSQYREYFQVNEKAIGETESVLAYSPLVYNTKQSNNSANFIPELNYLILKFPNAYHIGIILSNYTIDYSNPNVYNYYSYMIDKLKSQNDLKMLLFITDIDKDNIPFSIQSSLMEKYNLFFEFVKKTDLQRITIQGIELREEDAFSFQKIVDQHRYAQLIFERFMSYLSVISNEIIFLPYFEKLHKELDLEGFVKAEITLNKVLVSYQKRTNASNFTNYANQTLLKEICRYSYLSRHTIYHERALIADEAASILEKRKIQELPLVVEICAPNSLSTINILDKCEKLLLFTASHNAYSLMTKLEMKTGNRFLPSNVSLLLSHLNPEYMMHQYPDELNGKVDLLVIGYGAGSQLNDLTRFIRYAYNWLSESGVLFISVYNKDAIVLNKHHIHDQRFENSPLYLSDYWTYMLNKQATLLKNLKAYSPENFQSTYLSLFDTEDINISTYPYISALINPDEYSRAILDEIREADKLFSSSGTHGQFIDVIARKSKPVEKSRSKIKNYLDELNIQYNYYAHTLAPDSNGIKQSLQAQNVSMSNATLLKTVILQKKNQKPPYKNRWIYAILPYDKRVAYDRINYELVPESLVLKRFNQGTISPLTVIVERANGRETVESIFLLNNDRINTEYVIMGGGSNSESIRIKTKAFRKIMANANVSIQNIIE